MMSVIQNRSFTIGTAESDGSYTARRIYINAEVLKSAKICVGDVLAISNDVLTNRKFAIGIAWPSQDVPAQSILVSRSHLLTLGLLCGDGARVFPLNGLGAIKSQQGFPSIQKSKNGALVYLNEISTDDGPAPLQPTSKEKKNRVDWLVMLIREYLIELKYITPRQILEIIYENKPRRFIVASVRSVEKSQFIEDVVDGVDNLSIAPDNAIWTLGWDCTVSIGEPRAGKEFEKLDIQKTSPPSVDPYALIGGLDKQIAQIRDLIEIPLTRPDLFRHFGLKPPRGLLLHGPPGTGKTHLARAIAASTRSSVIVINGPELSSAYHGETESKLRAVFVEANQKAPCIVVLDEVDALVPKREDGAGGEVEKRVVATLLTILDGMEDEDIRPNGPSGGRVVVIGTTNRPNAIDPALRRPGRFDREIEIGVPDVVARASILRVLLAKAPHTLSSDNIYTIASHAHGYVGADLSAVVREAGTLAIKRHLSADLSTPPMLTLSDLENSLPTVRPSAMRSLFIDAPRITYADIGGQAEVIAKLKEAVEWPLKHPEAFTRLGVKPPKGVLLYGPPGCSKTVLVRACACESGINFLAVKGPELLNKYVGESEKAVREIFSKARATAPSIIFFDEIDALATSRSGSDTTPGSHEGVLTSLLNEMDGVQELVGVTVVAATNRPRAIDGALMRPGRLDRLLYVGPPDLAGRKEILTIRMKGMSIAENVDVSEIARLTEGFSGAEMSALCQEAALWTMKKDMNAANVPHEAFVHAATMMPRQITRESLDEFQRWRQSIGAGRVDA